MVSEPSKLIDPSEPIVLDTGIVINLAATGFADRILGAFSGPVIVLDAVLDDLERNSESDRPALEALRALVAAGLVRLERTSDLREGYFESLVAGPSADTLDDGEAATIALALEKAMIAVVDERKALRICRENYPSLRIASTIDILSNSSVRRALGRDLLRVSVEKALGAHMRVFPEYIDWLVDLLGADVLVKFATVSASIKASLLK